VTTDKVYRDMQSPEPYREDDPLGGHDPYSASKAGVIGLTKALANEWAGAGVNVNAVGPGIIETPLTRAYMDQHPDRVQATIANTPLRRLGQPEDVADVVHFLVSDASRFITGQTVFVDGGVSAGSAWW